MSYELTDENRKLQAMVRDFADTVVAPAAYEYDTKRALPYGIIAEMGEMGLFGLPFPKEYGGQGRDYFALCLALEDATDESQRQLTDGLGDGVEVLITAAAHLGDRLVAAKAFPPDPRKRAAG